MGFVIIVVMSLYPLITIVVVELEIRLARKHDKSTKPWGLGVTHVSDSILGPGYDGLYLPGEWAAGNFSEQYLTDRAYLLNQLLSRNIQDSGIIPATDGRLEYFDDRASNTTAATFLTALGIPDNAIRYSFGDANADTTNGGAWGNHLYGGAEVDVWAHKTYPPLVGDANPILSKRNSVALRMVV